LNARLAGSCEQLKQKEATMRTHAQANALLASLLTVLLFGCGYFNESDNSDYLNAYREGPSAGAGGAVTTPGPTRLGGQGMLGN